MTLTLRLLFLSEEFAEECFQLLRPLLVDGGTPVSRLQPLHLFTESLVLHGVLGDGGVVFQLVLELLDLLLQARLARTGDKINVMNK